MTSPIPTEGGHTPGPWSLRLMSWAPGSPTRAFMVTAPSRKHSVASNNASDPVNNEEFSAAELEANARLIAAAPALLEALTKVNMSAVIIPGMPSEAALPTAVLKEVAAALAQATGGEDVRR